MHGLSWDEDRLLEVFLMLDLRDQGLLMKEASIAACYAAARRASLADGSEPVGTPEAVALKALWQCAPRLPCGWISDSDFQFEVENAVRMRLEPCAVDMILTTSDHDERNAADLADWAETHARLIGPNFAAPSFDEGYVSADAMRLFIEEWRESFMSNLRRGQSQRKRGAAL